LRVENLGSDGYQLAGLVPSSVGHNIDENILAAEAAMEILKTNFTEVEFYVWSKLDNGKGIITCPY
jgi:hypothetical protein